MRGITVWMAALLFSLLSADAHVSRYSAQITSWPLSRGIDAVSLPDASCYVVRREGFYTMRCGCEGPFDKALKHLLPRYKRRFKSAFLANCDEGAFADRNSSDKPRYEPQKRQKRRYAVQVLSYPLSQASLLDRVSPEAGCYRVVREKFEAIRCGCYARYDEAKAAMKEARKSYGSAFVTYCDEAAYRHTTEGSAKPSAAPSGDLQSADKETETPESTPKKERVTDSQPAPKSSPSAQKASKSGAVDRSLLDRIYLSFLYSGDMVHALQTAELALRQSAQRKKWLKRAMDAASMLGEDEKALEYTRAYFEVTRDRRVLDRLIDSAMGKYQYEQALYLLEQRHALDPRSGDIPQLASLYDKVGEPEAARDLLFAAWKRHPERREWLKDALQISLDMGDVEGAVPIVAAMERSGPVGLREAEQLSYYYFLKRQMERAFEILIRPGLDQGEDEAALAYYRKVSGLGWMLGRYREAAEASLRLILAGEGDENDYYRAIVTFQTLDKERAYGVAMEALRRFQGENYFYSAAAIANDLGDDARLAAVFDAVGPALGAKLRQEPDYYILLGGLRMRQGRLEEAREALQEAYHLAPDDSRVVSALMWFYLDNDMVAPLVSLMQQVEADGAEPFYYPVLAAAHMELQHGDRANFYMHALHQKSRLSPDEQANLAYLYQAQMRMALYRQQMWRLYRRLRKMAADNPDLWDDGEFWDAYLRASMEFVGGRRYRKLLRRAKPHLKPHRYKEIALLWDLKRAEYERSRKKLEDWRKVEPWILLSLALHFNDMSGLQAVLYRHAPVLPIRDRVEAARADGQIAMAQSLAFEGLEYNGRDYLLFYQREQLMRQESDRFELGGEWSSRESIARQKITLNNRNRLPAGYTLSESAWYARNRKPGKYLKKIPATQSGADVRLDARFDRGGLFLSGGAREGIRSYATGSVGGWWQPSDKIRAEAGYYHHEDTEDTTWLMLGGYADRYHLSADYRLLNSTTITAHGERVAYAGDDGKKSGEGWKYGLSLFRVWRTGYPDIQFSLYAEQGRFDRYPAQGVLRELMNLPDGISAAPSDYSIVGGGLFVGYLNRNDYIRAWRPYASVSPYYDYESQTGSAGAEIGVGGSLWQQDHLNLSLRYSPALYRGQEDLVTLYFMYRMMY